MSKTAARKPAPSARVGVVKKPALKKVKVADLPAKAQGERLAAYFGEIEQFWAGKPKTKAVETLISLRRGEV